MVFYNDAAISTLTGVEISRLSVASPRCASGRRGDPVSRSSEVFLSTGERLAADNMFIPILLNGIQDQYFSYS